MKLPRWFPVAALILFALLLGGCINIKQEYWLYEDGSAKVGMDIGMSQALLSMGATGDSGSSTSPFEDLKSEFNDSNPNIKNVEVREYADNDLQHFEVTFEVDDFEQFLAEEASQGSEFNISLTRTPDDNILFKQITELDTGGDTSGMDVESMGPVFKDMYWSVIVHVPQVIDTNGERLDNSTVQWKIPMADVFTGKAPGELTMTYKPRGAIGGGGIFGGGGPSFLPILIGGIVVLVIVGAAVYFLVLRKRPAAVPQTYASYPPPAGQPPQGPPPQWNAQPPQGPPPQWNAQPPQGPSPQWNALPPQGPPPQWNAQPPQGPPPQGGELPSQAENPPPQWNIPPQPGTPGGTPQQPQPPQQPPEQNNQTPLPEYPAYPQYSQAPQYPQSPSQGNDYYPPYPPQQPPAAPPPVEPPADDPEQS